MTTQKVDLIEDSNLTRLEWLRKTYIRYMVFGDDQQASFYRRLADEAWEMQYPVEVITNFNRRE